MPCTAPAAPGVAVAVPPPSHPPTVVITQASHWGALARGTCLTIRAARQGGAVLSGREAAQCRAVVGRNGARCLPGVCPARPSWSREARHTPQHTPRHTRHGAAACTGPSAAVSSTCRARGECLRLSLSGQRCCRGPSPQRPLPAPESPVLGAGRASPPGCRGLRQGQIQPLSPAQRWAGSAGKGGDGNVASGQAASSVRLLNGF